MNKKTLHERLTEELRTRIPNNAELVNSLSDILYVGKEAIYRRLRGEVPFTLEEASTIAYHVGISLDFLNEVFSMKKPFVFKIVDFANPQENDYSLINEFVDFLEFIKDHPDTEIGTATKIIPDALHLHYPYITRFYLVKWIYQYQNNNSIKKFKEIKGSDRLLKTLNKMADMFDFIKTSYYIFDKNIFKNFVEDVKYFYEIGLVDQDDIQLLKNDLHSCIENINQLATKGINKQGNQIDIYLSNLNFEAGFSFVKTENYKLSAIRAFTMYDITSNDITAYEKSLKWMQSLKRASTLISGSGEIERISFFKKQYELINDL